MLGSLNPITLTVNSYLPIERSTAAQVAPIATTAVAGVGHDAIRSQPRATTSGTPDRSLLHNRLEHDRFMPLSLRHQTGHRLAAAFRPQMHFRGPAATAPA